jgi:GrpB-like predicted nucleotidyltransferase (UPF0157 family)
VADRERRPVHLVPHDPTWAAAAQREAERLMQVIGEVIVAIHHIGSTAVPGIRAKPVLDLIPEVSALELLDAAAGRLEALGYIYRGEFGIPGRRYCTWDDPATGVRCVQLHCFASGHPELARMVTFRDHLRANPDRARAYEVEKERCRMLSPDDTMAYAEAKTAWIRAELLIADRSRPPAV